MLLAVFLSGVALGVSEDPQAVTLLQQHGLHLTLSSQEDLSLLSKLRFMPHNSLAVPTLDANGRLCLMCDLPPAERAPNQSYVQRTDCGNHSVFEDAAILQVPLSTFQQNATEEHNQTFGWCELNVQKSCADAVYNKDYMLFAKSILVHELAPGVASWDQYFCFYNGWLSSEIKALQHDFQGMYAKGRDFCNSEDLIKRGSQGNTTVNDVMARWLRGHQGLSGDRPTIEDSLFLAAASCALGGGSSACDMAYCAYSFCLKDDGFGTYDECQGWDPVKGMPI